MASEVNHHVGYSRENECWFVRFYPYQTEQQASEAAAAFTRPAPVATDTGIMRLSLVRGGGLEPNQNGDYIRFSQAEELLAAERAEKEQAKDDLTRVLVHFVREHFPENTTFKPFDDLIGLITQFDNASTIAREYVSRIRSLEADNAAKDARIKELGDERYKLAYAITGGEDAPGYLDSLSVETLVEVARDNARRWFAEIDRAEALEAKLAAAENGVRYALANLRMNKSDEAFLAAVLGGKTS